MRTDPILSILFLIAADAQKYFTVRLQSGLINDGMFRYVRHANYVGENDDLWQLRAYGPALGAGRCPSLGLGRIVRGKH